MNSLALLVAPAAREPWCDLGAFRRAATRCWSLWPGQRLNDHEHMAQFCYNVRRTPHGGWRSLRRWLFLGVFSGAMMLGQVALAAGSAVQGAVVDMDAVLVGVITLAVFFWIYSLIS